MNDDVIEIPAEDLEELEEVSEDDFVDDVKYAELLGAVDDEVEEITTRTRGLMAEAVINAGAGAQLLDPAEFGDEDYISTITCGYLDHTVGTGITPRVDVTRPSMRNATPIYEIEHCDVPTTISIQLPFDAAYQQQLFAFMGMGSRKEFLKRIKLLAAQESLGIAVRKDERNRKDVIVITRRSDINYHRNLDEANRDFLEMLPTDICTMITY